MNLLLSYLIVACSAICCLNCVNFDSQQCLSCVSGYYRYNQLICVKACPTGYGVVNKECVKSIDAMVLDLKFFEYSDINDREIDGFSNNYDVRFTNTGRNSLIPTKDKGFYSDSYSVMFADNNWMPGPDMTFMFWIFGTSSGVIFEVVDSTSKVVQIYLSTNYTLVFRSKSQNNGQLLMNTFLSKTVTLNTWQYVKLTISQSSATRIIVNILVDGNQVANTLDNQEFYADSTNTWVFGSSSGSGSFGGFIYEFRVDNQIVADDLSAYSLNYCGYFTYLSDSNSCLSCDGSCSWDFCTQSGCSICDQCVYCRGYNETDCSCGGDTCCQRGCIQCLGIYTCELCQDEYDLLNGVCIAKDPFINTNFTGDFLGVYGKFRTGASEDNFYFKSDPEASDPIPIRYRGLYFNSKSYLEYNEALSLNSDFTVALWIKYQSGGVLGKGTLFNYEFNQVQIAFTNISSSSDYIYYVSTTISLKYLWTHLAIGVSTLNLIQLSTYLDNELFSKYADLNIVFIDDKTVPLLLGKSQNSYFLGFIYSFKLWQMHISDFAFEFLDEICGKSLSSACLSECPLNAYQSNECTTCSSSCAWGCVDSRTTCTICSSYLCELCDSFDTSVCLQCISDASGVPCNCNDKFYESNYICNPCYTRCATCTNRGYGCTTCVSNTIQCEIFCVTVCPTGYALSTNVCSKVSNSALSLDFRYTFELKTIDNFVVGSDSENSYADFDINDPWPAVNRGFYFASDKYLVGQLIFSPLFSLGIWVRTVSAGVVFRKAGMVSLTAVSVSSYQVMINLMNGNVISTTVNPSAGWVFISFFISVLSSNTVSQVSVYVNSGLIDTSSQNGFISDIETPDFIIGGFNGFIATLNVYTGSSSGLSTYTLACLTCTCSYCLSSCTISQDPINNCSPCPSDCIYGCNNGICSLCSDSICETCLDRLTPQCTKCTENASGFPCTCIEFYFSYLGKCYKCFDRCSTCISFGFWCTGCKETLKLLNNFCINECPTGSSVNGQICTINEFVLAYVEFRNVINLSMLGGFSVGSEDNNTYPEYDENDPWPSNERGYYFHEQAYMGLDCVLAPNVTVTMWVLVKNDGIFLTKSSENASFIISSSESTFFFNLSFLESNITLNSNFNNSNWVLFSINLYIDLDKTTISLYISSSLVQKETVATYFSDGYSTLYLPSFQNSSFLGFIWFLGIYQYSGNDLNNYLPIPENNCSINTYSFDCEPCEVTCNYTCESNSCNICPDKLCYSCSYFNETCDLCKENSSIVDGICDCNPGFYAEFEECYTCYPFCRDCTFKYITNCTKCFEGYYFLNKGICGICGLGFEINGDNCEEHNVQIFGLNLNNTMKGVVIESINGFEVTTGLNSKFYPLYDNSDPYVAYLRGYYFNGVGSFMSVKNDKFVLPYKFELDFWLNPIEGSGFIFSKGNFTVHIDNFYLKTSVILTDSQLNLVSNEPLLNKSWNHIILIHSFENGYTTVEYNLWLNTSLGYFNDYSNLAIFGKNGNSFLTGFLFTFNIYSSRQTQRYLQTCLEPCNECLESGYCIPNCLINEYWTGPNYNDCKPCESKCGTGCRSPNTCSLCADQKCKKCESLEPESSCNSCFLNSNLKSSCECDSGYYWNSILLFCFTCESNQYEENEICKNCSDLCLTCTNLDNCLTCIENASIENTMCYCDIGYKEANGCVRHVLNLVLVVDSNNQGSLQFNESLKYELGSEDVNVEVNGTWSLEKYSDRFYKIKIESSGAVGKGESVRVNLINLNKFVSVTNATPDTYFYEQSLFEVPAKTNSVLEAAKQLAQTVTTAVTSAVTAASLMNPNPACLWSFINTIQMIVFIMLATVPIPPKSKGLIIGLKNYNMFPNIFEYFVNENDKHNNQNAYDLGYNSDSLLLNTGKAITAFIFFMLLWGILGLLNVLIKKKYCTKKIFVDNVREFLADYKYGFFIRYGITNFIEFEIAALIGLLNYNHHGIYSLLNTVFCSITIILLISTPILCLIMIIKRKRKSMTEQQEFDTMYGTLFYEFNNDKGLMTSNFYVFFFLKRGVYGAILMFLTEYGVIQMTLILILCFSYLLYLLFFKPFGEKLLNFSNIFSEVATLLIFSMITWLLFDLSDQSRERLDNVIYYLVYIIMGIQMVASVGLMVKTIKDKIAAKKANKTAAVVPMSVEDIDPEVKNLNIVSNSNDVSRVELIDEARSRKTASNFSKYGKFFEE